MLTLQEIALETGTEDREGQLVFLDGALVGVIVRLKAPEHDGLIGKWFFETGFGPFRDISEVFDSPETCLAWLSKQL